MKKGGSGGARTITGLRFEEKVNLLTKIAKLPGYLVKDDDIYFEDNFLGTSYAKYSLYKKLLEPNGIDYKKFVSKHYLPDEAIFVPSRNTLYVVEMKFQNGGGSVDEKPQTADFKKKIYLKLTAQLNIKIQYCLVLSDYFNKPSFDDAFQYIKESGCSYFFNELPLAWLEFPEPVIPAGQPTIDDLEVTI